MNRHFDLRCAKGVMMATPESGLCIHWHTAFAILPMARRGRLLIALLRKKFL